MPSGPFEGTLAESYPKGAGGITLSAAKAVTGFSAAEAKAAPCTATSGPRIRRTSGGPAIRWMSRAPADRRLTDQ